MKRYATYDDAMDALRKASGAVKTHLVVGDYFYGQHPHLYGDYHYSREIAGAYNQYIGHIFGNTGEWIVWCKSTGGYIS